MRFDPVAGSRDGDTINDVSPCTLITGGAGFIGCSLASRLVEHGGRVVALDNLHPQVHTSAGRPSALHPSVELVPGDVTHPSTWDAALSLFRPSTIVHLAAETGTGQSLTQSTRHGSVNVVGTTAMLDALSRSGFLPGHIVLASSRAVYGDGEWRRSDGSTLYVAGRHHEDMAAGRWDPVDEGGSPLTPMVSSASRTEPRPTNIYAATKLAQEHILSAWCSAMSVPLSTLRFQNVYGPGQALGNPYTGVLALFARLSIEGKPIDVFEDGLIIRDFVFVDDVADALLATCMNPPSRARVLDIGSGEASTILEVAQVIAQLAGSPSPQISQRFRDGDVRAAFCEISAAADQIGYTAHWPLQRGVAALLDWVRATHGLEAASD
jgi:dTDP-L-rhamnose 4-epimerase